MPGVFSKLAGNKRTVEGRPRSKQLQEAVDAFRAGMQRALAAETFGVKPNSLNKAIARDQRERSAEALEPLQQAEQAELPDAAPAKRMREPYKEGKRTLIMTDQGPSIHHNPLYVTKEGKEKRFNLKHEARRGIAADNKNMRDNYATAFMTAQDQLKAERKKNLPDRKAVKSICRCVFSYAERVS